MKEMRITEIKYNNKNKHNKNKNKNNTNTNNNIIVTVIHSSYLLRRCFKLDTDHQMAWI